MARPPSLRQLTPLACLPLPQAAADAGAAQQRQGAARERQLQVVAAVVHHPAVLDRVRDVRRVLERVRLKYNSASSIPSKDSGLNVTRTLSRTAVTHFAGRP